MVLVVFQQCKDSEYTMLALPDRSMSYLSPGIHTLESRQRFLVTPIYPARVSIVARGCAVLVQMVVRRI